MSLLPGLKNLVHSQKCIVLSLIIFLLFTLHLSLLTTPAFAAHTPNPVAGEPNPRPCENPLYTNQLTKVVLEPKEHIFKASGNDGDKVTLSQSFEFEVDFSQLAAIFAPPNSNYLEGKFQDNDHRTANLLALESNQFNQFHGPGQKAAPQVMTDQLRKEYVEYVYYHPHLPEASAIYSDVEGGGNRRIYDLVREFGLPKAPSPRTQDWLQGWGRYWEKVPTAVNEFYLGILAFSAVTGPQQGTCDRNLRRLYFVLPEYLRTTGIANQLNQVIVPQAAQSSTAKFIDNNLRSAVTNTKAALAKIIEACLKPFIDMPLAKVFGKVVKISLDWLSPIKPAYATSNPTGDRFGRIPEPCPKPIPNLPKDKEGLGPFCSLPERDPVTGDPQLRPGDNCQDVPSANKLDEGLLVKCTLIVTFQTTLLINGPGWDPCTPSDDGSYTCILTLKIYPLFYIPWLAPIWNNTTYSHKQDQDIGAVFNTPQKTGQPGAYTFFKPKSVDFKVFPDGKNLPSKEQGDAQAIKQRFFGAVDCNKEFVRDVALKPKALQQHLGIKAGCEAK